MNRNLSVKLAMITTLIVLLLIPLFLIGNLISERQARRDGVLEDIARSSSTNQQLSGPVLVVPYRKTEREWKTDEKTGSRYQEESHYAGRLYFLPQRFDLAADLRTELRARGIYEARLYHASNHIEADFQLPAQLGITDNLADYQFEAPFLAVGISDIRGIEAGLNLELDGQRLDFQPGTQVSWLGNGVHVQLPLLDAGQPKAIKVGFDLGLQGTGRFDVLPVGRETSVALKADWPHPSFVGDYLPVQRNVAASGFDAHWQTSFFSTNLQERLDDCVHGLRCETLTNTTFGVSLVDPVDQYLKADRAIKYALLFVALTFAGFFLFEVLKRLAIHPMQYALVGFALALFYLLLLSLAEHIGFALAYGLSASGCVLLIGFYVSHVLHSWRNGLGFGAGLAALYGLLFGLLSAEDYALLMGSLLLFAMLGLFMVLTRRLDWYGVGQGKAVQEVGHVA
ncbi:cell envelope integrity protein CreD [Pseudomonas putida]